MMEMDADAAATASNEEEDGHLLREESDKGGMDSSQDKKKEEKSTAVPVPDKTEKDSNKLTEPVKDHDSIVKDTVNAKECSNNGNQNKPTDGSHSKTSVNEDKGALSSTNPLKTVDKPIKEQKSEAAEKPLLQPNSGSSKPALPLSKPISAPSSTVPATLLKPSSENRTATAKDSITTAVSDVATAPSSTAASTGAIRKTTSNSPATSSQTASSSSSGLTFKSSVTTTTHPVKAVASSSSTGSGNITAFTAKPLGGNVGPSIGFQHKIPIQAPAPSGLTAKTSDKPALISKTSSLPTKPSPVQSATPQTTSPSLLTKTSSSISSSVVSSSTSSAKQVPKLPSTGSQSSPQNVTKNPSTVTTASTSVSSTSSSYVSSSSPSRPVSLPSSPPLISSKVVPPLLPVPKPSVNPKFSSPGPTYSGSSSNTLPIKLSRNQTPSPSISSLTRQPVLPPVSKSTPPPNPRSSDRPLVQSKLSFPSTSSSSNSKSISPHSSPLNRQLSSAAFPSTSFTNNSSSSAHPSSTNVFPGSSRTPLSRPGSSNIPPRSPLVSQKPSMPSQTPTSSPRPLFPQRSSYTPPRVSLPLPNPPVSSRHLPLNQSPSIHSRPYLPVRSIPPQRPLLQRDNATSSATDFSVPDVRRDCPAGPHPATPPASLVPDVLRTGSEEEDRQLERMLRPTPFGGGIPPPHMPDLCHRGRDVPLIPSRIVSLPSSEADIDLLRPATAAGHTGPDVNESSVSALERMDDSPSIEHAENNIVGAGDGTRHLSSGQPNVLVNVEQSQGAARQDESTGPSSSVCLPQRSEPFGNPQDEDGTRKSSSSSSGTNKDDVEMVLASNSSADSQPKDKKPLQKDDKNNSEESSGACALNMASGTKENENKGVESLKTDFKKTVPAQDNRKDSFSTEGEASSDLGADSKTKVSVKEECPVSGESLGHDDKKLDLAVSGETPQQKDSSCDTKGERMTVERAEVNKSSLVGEEENDSSLMLPPPVADLPADLAKEDGAKTKKGDEGTGGKNMEGEGNGSAERPPVSGIPAHDSVKAAEAEVGKSAKEDKRSLPSDVPVAEDAAQPKVSAERDVGKSTQTKKDRDSASGGSGMISSPSSRTKVGDPPSKGKVDAKGEEKKDPSKAVPRDGKEMIEKKTTDVPVKIGHSIADEAPERKKIPESEDLEANKTSKPSDRSTKEKDGCRDKTNVGPIMCDEFKTKDISPDGAVKSETGEADREFGRVLPEEDTDGTSGKGGAKGEGVSKDIVVEKDVSVGKKRLNEPTRKEHLEGAGKSKTVEVSSGSGCVSKTAAAILKVCNAKDLSILEEKKIRDKHKADEEVVGMHKSVGSLGEKSGEKSSPCDGVASVEGVTIETKGYHQVKSQMLPIVGTKLSTTIQGVCLEQKMNKKSTDLVVTKDAKSEVLSKTNTNPSVGNSQIKISPSSQVQIRKNSNEKETEDSQGLDNKSSDCRPIVAPQKVDLPTLPVTLDSKITKIDLKNVIHADEQIGSSVRVDKGGEKEKIVENKTSTCNVVPLNPDRSSDFVEVDAGKIAAKSDISISKLETSLEVKDSVKLTVDKKSLENIDNNSVLGNMHFSNMSHVSEKVPAKLKECVVDSKETLVNEKKRLPTAASNEKTDSKHLLTENDVCDAKRDAVSNSDQEEKCKQDKSAAKCLSGDKTLLKTSTQVFNVEIEAAIECKNVRTNESSKGLSNTVPPALVVVQKPDAAAISSLKEASVAQNKLKSTQIDSKDLAKDVKVVYASSGKTGDKTSLSSKQVSVSTINIPKSQSVEMKIEEGTNNSSKNSDDQASFIGTNVDHRCENKTSILSEVGKEKTVVPLTRNESCLLSLSKVPDIISPKCDTVNREEKLSFQVDSCKSDVNIPASAPKRDQFSNYKEKKADDEHSKDIPCSKEVSTDKPKTDLTLSKEGVSDMDSAHLKEIIPSVVKITDSEAKCLVKPYSSVVIHIPAKEINVEEGNVVPTVRKDFLKNPKKEADGGGMGEEISPCLKEVTEISKVDGNKSDFKTSSLGNKNKIESSPEEKVKPEKTTKETSMLKKSSSVSIPQADENFSGSKNDSYKIEKIIAPEIKSCLKKENDTPVMGSPKECKPPDTMDEITIIEDPDVNSKESCKNVTESENVLQLLKGSKDVKTTEKGNDDGENVDVVKTDSLQPVTGLAKSNKELNSDMSNIPSPSKTLKYSEDAKVSEEATLLQLKDKGNSDSTVIHSDVNEVNSNLDDLAIKSSELIPTIFSKGTSVENSSSSESGSISTDEGKNKSTSVKKVIQDGIEDLKSAENNNSRIAEETESESKEPILKKNISEEKKSEKSVDLIGKKVSVEVSDKSPFINVDQEIKQGSETIPEIKASDSDERSKLAYNVRTGSPILTISDADNSELAKSKKRGEIKQTREKSILGVTERLVVANQMRQQKQSSSEPLPKESTSPRKMPGLIEMGVAKASRRKTLAVKDDGRIKKSKTTHGQESGESGLNKILLNSLSEQPSDVSVSKYDLVSNEQTPSIEEAKKLEGISEMNSKSESLSSLNLVREQDDVMTISVQGACNIIDLSSKPIEKDKNLSLADCSIAENASECQSLALKNEITVILTDKEPEIKTLNEGKLEVFPSTVPSSFVENNNSPVVDNKVETKKEDSGFKFPRIKRNSGKDSKPLIESSIQPVGPTTRTRAGYKMTPSPPPVRPSQKPDEAREKNYSKGLKGVPQKDEKVIDSELKRKSLEVSTEVFVKESDPRRMDALHVEDHISLGSSSSQSSMTSSKILEVIRVAEEKGRDIVKVNDVEVMREPVGTNVSPLSLLRKAANVTPVFSSSLSVSTQEPRKDQSPDIKTVSECVQSEAVCAGSKFPLGNTESWEFVAKVGEVELLRESPRAPPKPAASPLTITVESPAKKGKEKPEGRKPGRPPSMPPPPKTIEYAVPPMLEQAFLAHQNYRNHSLEVLVGMTNRQDGSPVDVRPTSLGMQIGSNQVTPWQMPNEDRSHSRGRPAGMDFTAARTPTSDMTSDMEPSSDKRKKVTKPRTAPPPKWSNQEADMLSVKVDGHPLGNWAPGDWRSMPPSSMQMWPPSFGYGHSVRPRGPMESRCSRSVSPPSHSVRDVRSLEQLPEDLSSPPLPRGRRDSPHSFRHPFVHPATSFPGGTPNFSNVSVMTYPSHSPKSASALNLAKCTATATPPSDTAMNLTMCKQMSATPPPSPAMSSPNSQSPRQSSLPVNLVKSRSSSPKGPPAQNTQSYDGRGAVLPGGIVVPNLPLIFGRDYSMPANPPTGRISHCSAEENRETEASVSQVRCSSEPPRDHLQEKNRDNTAFIATNFAQRMANSGMPSNFPPAARPAGNTNTGDASASRNASGEANLLPGGVVIPNLFPPGNARPGEEQWNYENMRPDLPVRSASALSQYHIEESTSKPPTPRMPTPVPVPPPPTPAPPQTCTPPPPIPPPKTGPGRRGGRSETPPPDKYNFRVEEAHVVRSSDLGPGGGQGGSKLFACDICSGVYRRAFSLKRHYLRAHINYCHLSERDLSNCGIVVGDKMAVHTGGSGRRPYVHTTMPRNLERSGDESERSGSGAGGRRTLLRDLFRCHTCGVCFDEKKRLKSHLMEHQCGSNRPSLLRQHAATHASPVYVPKTTPTPKPHSSSPTPVVFLCAYCDKRFSSAAVRRRHRKLHESSPGPHPCYLCETAEDLPDVPLGETPSFAHLEDLRSHMASIHKEVYHSCALCGERLPSILALEEHAEGHRSRRRTDASDEDEDEEDTEVARVAATPSVERSAPPENVQPSAAAQEEEEFRYTCGVCQKMFTNYVNMCRHRRLAHGAAQTKVVGRKAGTGVSSGKQGGGDSGSSSRSQSPVVVSQTGGGERGQSNRDILDGEPSSSSSSSVPSPCPYQPSNAMSANDPETIFYTRLASNIRDNLLNYLDGKLNRQNNSDKRTKEEYDEVNYMNGEPRTEPYLSWEKYNFPKDFQQMSCWDISTQLVVRKNIKRANSAPSVEHQDEQKPAFPETLALVETSKSADLVGDINLEEEDKKEDVPVEGEWSGLSGEWVRPRSYICCACASRFGDLWSLEDHQLARHPNVWCTHLEVEDGSVTLPGSPKLSPGSANVAVSFLGDLLCRRPLGPRGALLTAPAVPPTLNNGMESPSARCTKCSRLCPSLPDLHSHMLECGGDLAWAAWAGGSSPAAGSSRRNSRKWRPFGSRRRRQRGRRGMKRNIPSSPVKMHRARHRGTDSDSIQRMIANLPAKRATRRVIQFNEDEIKTRSQATIHSVSFPGNFVRVSGFKPSHGVKPATPTAAKRGRPPKNPVIPPPVSMEGVSILASSPMMTASPPPSVASGTNSSIVVVKKGRGRPPGSKSKTNPASIELTLKRRIGESPTESGSPEGDRYSLVKRSRTGVSPVNQHQSSSATQNAPAEPYICKGCGNSFDNASSCERHMKKCVFRRQSPATPTGDGTRVSTSGTSRPVHSCPHCGKNFTYATPMEKHVRACGGMRKGQPIHIRRVTAPGIICRPSSVPPTSSSEMNEEEDVKKELDEPPLREPTPPPPKEPDMPQLQKEEPVASPLPKEEDIPVLTPVESEEGEEKQEVIEDDIQIEEPAAVTILQEIEKPDVSDNNTVIEMESNEVTEDDTNFKPLEESKVEVKEEIICVDSQPMVEESRSSPAELAKESQEMPEDKTVIENLEEDEIDDKEDEESLEDRLFRTTGKRLRLSASSGQVSKKNKIEDEVTEPSEEEESVKKKPGRKSVTIAGKSKIIKGTKGARASKSEEDTTSTPEEDLKSKSEVVAPSHIEIKTEDKRDDDAIAPDNKSQTESNEGAEKEESKIPVMEEHAQERTPVAETKGKRGRKPKQIKTPTLVETITKNVQEVSDSTLDLSSIEKDAIPSDNSSQKLPDIQFETAEKESKIINTIDDSQSKSVEDKKLAEISKEDKGDAVETREEGNDSSVAVDEVVQNHTEKESAVEEDSKPSEEMDIEKGASEKEESEEMKEEEKTKREEEEDEETSAAKDKKLRGTKGTKGKVSKPKKKRKKWQDVKKEVENFWCDVCQMGYSSAFNLVKHGMSQKHKWNLRLGKEKAEKEAAESNESKKEEDQNKDLPEEGKVKEVEMKEEEKSVGEQSAEEEKGDGKNDDEKKGGKDEDGAEKTENLEKCTMEEEKKSETKILKKDVGTETEGSNEVVINSDLKNGEALKDASLEGIAPKTNEKQLPDSSKSKEEEPSDTTVPDDSICKDAVSDEKGEGVSSEQPKSTCEETKDKEYSSGNLEVVDQPFIRAETATNSTASNATDCSTSSRENASSTLVSQTTTEKLSQMSKDGDQPAPANEAEGNITKASPEAVVAAAPESATVIEGTKSTSEGVQCAIWQEAPSTPAPSQEFLQPPIPQQAPSSTGYNPYEWDNMIVQPTQIQPQDGSQQHLHQTQQDGWGVYGTWDNANTDPNPPPSPGLWRYQPPTPIPWGEPQHSLSPIPRLPSYTEDPPPVTHPSPPNPSLGSILDSVNRILGEDGSGFDSTRIHAATAPEDEYGSVGLFGEGGLAELQRAMGATDEEMAMLQQLGTGPLDFVYDNNAGITSVVEGSTEVTDQTGPLPNAELVDLDNQTATVSLVEEGPVEEAEAVTLPPVAVEASNASLADGRSTKRKRCGPMPSKCKRFPPPNREGRSWRGGRRPALQQTSLASAHLLISQYEKKEMVCPVCNRHFLGLAALETHVAWVHKMKDAKQHILEGETAGNSAGKKSTPTASNSLRELVVGRAGAGGGVVGGVAGASSPTPSRRLPCFVCKELYSDVISLNHHIAQQHLRRRPGEAGVVPEMDGDLKSQMTSALGGLLGKALANMRSRTDTIPVPRVGGLTSTVSKSTHLNFPKLNLLGKSLDKMSTVGENIMRRSYGGPSSSDVQSEGFSRAEPSSESPEVTLFRRDDGLDPSEWSSDGEDSAKGHDMDLHDEGIIPSFHHICPFCGDRFQKMSSRNKHISVAHRDPTCIDLMRIPRSLSHEGSEFDDLINRGRKDDVDSLRDETSEESQETGRRQNHHPCPACQLSFLRHSQLEAHLKRVHNGSESQLPDTSDSMMECPICRESMNHFLKLCKHVKAKHREWSINCFTTDQHHHLILRKESPEESMVIRKKFLVKMKAFPVLRMASPTPSSKSSEEESYMDPDPKGNYLCSVCGVNFKSPQGVIRHLNLEHNSNHLEGALPMQKIFPRHTSKEYRGRTGGGSGSDIKAKAEAALRELNLSQKMKLGSMASSKGMVPHKGTIARKSSVTEASPGESNVSGGPMPARGGGRGRGSNRRGRGRRGGRVVTSSDVEKSLFDVYEFEDDEEETEEVPSQVGSADGSSRVGSECGGDDEEEEEEGVGDEDGKGPGAAAIRSKRASVDSSSSEAKYSCNSCGKGYKSLTAFWKHTKGVRGACAGGGSSPRSSERGQDVVLRGCKLSGKKGKEDDDGSDVEGEVVGGRVLRRLRGSAEVVSASESPEASQPPESEVPKKAEKGRGKGKKKAATEEEKKPIFSAETVRTYGGKRLAKQQQSEERRGRGSEEGSGGRRSMGASEAAFDALRGGGSS